MSSENSFFHTQISVKHASCSYAMKSLGFQDKDLHVKIKLYNVEKPCEDAHELGKSKTDGSTALPLAHYCKTIWRIS